MRQENDSAISSADDFSGDLSDSGSCDPESADFGSVDSVGGCD